MAHVSRQINGDGLHEVEWKVIWEPVKFFSRDLGAAVRAELVALTGRVKVVEEQAQSQVESTAGSVGGEDAEDENIEDNENNTGLLASPSVCRRLSSSSSSVSLLLTSSRLVHELAPGPRAHALVHELTPCTYSHRGEPPAAYAEMNHTGKGEDFRVSSSTGRKTPSWPNFTLIDGINKLSPAQDANQPSIQIPESIYSQYDL
ncbi:unnamed protein product [Zymoseptoria tritici ST99CH_1E4]|uniref:Uncharacterized protein n=1 Tax=Zymoseptoria tritici ST99CH_1E4 TaxID=1276532 RepID=A0A2H1H8Z9_ZYMTR|nr:unnamed protein product [Zymoseptoria tritici ST99CH_1E4]